MLDAQPYFSESEPWNGGRPNPTMVLACGPPVPSRTLILELFRGNGVEPNHVRELTQLLAGCQQRTTAARDDSIMGGNTYTPENAPPLRANRHPSARGP